MGRTMLFLGLGIAGLGALILLSQSVPWLKLGKLPGDISYQKDGIKIMFPITTMIVISILATLVMWLISAFRR